MKNNNPFIYKDKFGRLVFWGVCLILFLPIAVFPPTFQPSDWGRSLLFKTILTVLISFLFFNFFYKKNIALSIPTRASRVFPVVLALSLFFIVSAFSTLLSQDIRFSVFGSPSRSGGLLNLLFFFAFTILLTLFIENNWEKLFKANLIAGFLASLLAIIQYFGFFGSVFLSREGSGTPSFLGNSTFLAIYMLFLSLLCLALFIKESPMKRKLFYAFLFFIFLFTILITGSRATYFAMLIAIFYFLIFYPVRNNWLSQKNVRLLRITAFSFLALSILVMLVFNFFGGFWEKNVILNTIASRLSAKEIVYDLTGTRLAAWKITLEAIKEKPWFGWGLENFYIGFEKYYDPTLSNLQKLWWDKPHNAFLEIWVNSGIFALFSYIAFWIILLWQLQKIKHPEQREAESKHTQIMAHMSQAMFIGYLTVLFFNFDSFSTHLISFFFIGYSLFLISEKEEKIIIRPRARSFLQKKPAIAFLFILALIFIWFWNIKPFYINEKIVFIKNLADSKQCKKALSLAESQNWLNSGILKSYAALRYADAIKNCAYVEPEKEVYYSKKSLELLDAGSKLQPAWSRTWLFMGSFANILAANEKNPEDRNKLLLEAGKYLETARKLSPGRQEVLTEMEKSYLVANDFEAMKRTAYDCIKIDPSQGICFWYLGIGEIFLGDQANGKKHIEESLEKGGFPPPYMQLGAAYISQKNYKEAAKAYHMLTAIYPENPNYHGVMAFLSKELGDYERALTEVMYVFKLQPDNEDAVEFMQGLLELNKNSPHFHSSMAFIYKQLGEEEKAKKELLTVKDYFLSRALKYPQNPDYHFNLAIAYKELEEYDKAIDQAILAIKFAPESQKKVEEFLQSFPKEYQDKIHRLLTPPE